MTQKQTHIDFGIGLISMNVGFILLMLLALTLLNKVTISHLYAAAILMLGALAASLIYSLFWNDHLEGALTKLETST